MSALRERRLRTSLVLLLSGTTLFTLVIVSAGLLLFRLPQIMDENRTALERTVNETANRIEFILHTLEERVAVVDMAAQDLDPGNMQETLGAVLGDDFAAIYLVDGDGIVVANSVRDASRSRSRELIGIDLSANKLIRAARESETPLWSDKFLSVVTGKVGIAVAMKIDRFNGVVVAELPLDRLLAISSQVHAEEDLAFWIIDGRGEVVADTGQENAAGLNLSHLPVVTEGLTGNRVIEKLDFDNREYLVATAYSELLGWLFVSRAPYGLEDPRVREAVMLILIALVASPIVGFVFAPMWARRLNTDISQVIERAGQLTAGDLTSPWPRGRISEFNELSETLDIMSRAVKEGEEMLTALNQDLESRIKDRTQELTKSRGQLQSILDSSPMGIGLIAERDGEMKLVQANGGMSKMFHVNVDEVVGRVPTQYWKDPSKREALIERALSGRLVEDEEVVFIRADRSHFTGLVTMKPYPYASGRAVIYWIYDISLLKEVEKKLRGTLEELNRTQHSLVEAEKMASLGSLVAGVAHEINTPVGIGITAMSHLRDLVSETRQKYESQALKRADLEEFIDTADESARIAFANLERAADLVKSFKRVAVDQSSEEFRSFGMKDYLDELLVSLRPQLKKTQVEVEVDCDDTLHVSSYPGVFAQIITNLMMNALNHAYGDAFKGKISIAVTHDDKDVTLTFTDDGCGMDESTRRRVFDPFFTTKRGQGGTGLGMNVVFNLVAQRLGGTIECESAPGKGATFTITFPKQSPAQAVALVG